MNAIGNEPHKVSVVKTNHAEYPNKRTLFRPGERYPEYPFEEISQEANEVYDAVRQAFQLMGFDKEAFGTKDWNPLKEIIKPGNTVLIKPNMVMDVNGIPEQGTECLYTHPSVVAAVVDYVVIALQGKGKIVIGDAPMQECKFERLLAESGYSELKKFYRDHQIEIEVVDFRELKSEVKGNVHYAAINENASGRVVDLGEHSEFAVRDPDTLKKMRVTNYDPSIMMMHHNENRHEYYVSEYVLNADVIINMPKPKTHRKAGVTIALKNFVGINVRKEFLPHHTKGSTKEGGDEYSEKCAIHRLRSYLLDKRNIWQANRQYWAAHLVMFLVRGCSAYLKLVRNKYSEGSWYGNHTISKTIADLNKIVLYADKQGILRENKQRKMLIVADLIISGEKEGPVCPSAKEVAMVAAGSDIVCFDEVIATLMGFDVEKIPTIKGIREIKSRYAVAEDTSKAVIVSNIGAYDGKTYEQINKEETLQYEPTSGWKGHIELI